MSEEYAMTPEEELELVRKAKLVGDQRRSIPMPLPDHEFLVNQAGRQFFQAAQLQVTLGVVLQGFATFLPLLLRFRSRPPGVAGNSKEALNANRPNPTAA